MEWNLSNAIGLAKTSCTVCNGYGMRFVWKTEEPCECVYRAVFRACYNRFRECANGSITAVSLDLYPSGQSRRAYSRKKEEYAADFCLIGRRTLEPLDYDIFRYYYLLSLDWSRCSQRLQLDRNEFYRRLRGIQEKLGRAFAEQQPYSLYPINDYFDMIGIVPVPALPVRRAKRERNPIRLPLSA